MDFAHHNVSDGTEGWNQRSSISFNFLDAESRLSWKGIRICVMAHRALSDAIDLKDSNNFCVAKIQYRNWVDA